MSERKLSVKHKFAVFESLNEEYKGQRFYSMIGHAKTIEEMEKLSTGEVVYKVILTTDDQDEASETARNGQSDADMIRQHISSKGWDKLLGIDAEAVIKSLRLEE